MEINIVTRSARGAGWGVDCRGKVLSADTLPAWRAALRSAGKRLAVTNGCFDILHAGHVNYLEAARNQADALLVGLNSDESVRQLKGHGRPVQSQADRATVLAALSAVDAVFVFGETRATQFLELAEPDVYVKGGDYQVDQLPAEERAVAQRLGSQIIVLGHVPGRSASDLARKIAAL